MIDITLESRFHAMVLGLLELGDHCGDLRNLRADAIEALCCNAMDDGMPSHEANRMAATLEGMSMPEVALQSASEGLEWLLALGFDIDLVLAMDEWSCGTTMGELFIAELDNYVVAFNKASITHRWATRCDVYNLWNRNPGLDRDFWLNEFINSLIETTR